MGGNAMGAYGRSGVEGGGRLRRVIAALALACAFCLLIAAHASALTLGVGWTGEPTTTEVEMFQVQKSGAELFRVQLPPAINNDGVVRAAAEHKVKIEADLGEGEDTTLPANTATYVEEVEAEVRRYGCNGSFWTEHPSLNYEPISTWEIWNEPNRQSGRITASAFGQFVSSVATGIHSASACGTTEVLAGGLMVWGNSGKGETGESTYNGALKYLEGEYPYFAANPAVTGVAIHPYEIDPETFYTPPPKGPRYTAFEAFKLAVAVFSGRMKELAIRTESIEKGLWITETGWPAEGEGSVGPAEQASLLEQVVTYARKNASTLNLKGLLWYNLRDRPGSGEWNHYCGLRNHNGEYRPAWFSFQGETGAAKWPVIGDLVGVDMNGTGGHQTGVHVLSGASEFQSWLTQRESLIGETSPSQWAWTMGDVNGDGVPDLVGIQMNGTEKHHTTVHVLNGATEFQSYLTQRELPIGETSPSQWAWTMGDVNGDGIADLIGIQMNGTAGHHTTVHVFNGATEFQTYLTQQELPIGETSPSQWAWTMGDVNGDGIPDLVGIQMNGTSGHHTAVHVLNGATEYQTYLTQQETPIGETSPSQWQWTMGDVNGDGIADLVGVEMNETGGHQTGVHVLSGASEFQTYLTQRETPIGETTAGQWKFLMSR